MAINVTAWVGWFRTEQTPPLGQRVTRSERLGYMQRVAFRLPVSSQVVSAIDPTASISYLGPTGTFSEQAVTGEADLAKLDLRPYGTNVEVLLAAERGDVTYGFAAIENMIEGSVNATLDTLAFESDDLLIKREVVMNVNLNLLVLAGVSLSEITEVRSHPVALAQCRRYLPQQLAGVTITTVGSTADAAREVAENDLRTTAAIAPRRSAEVWGLEILAEDIEDHPENQTRFVLVGRDGIDPPSGHDKTSVLIYQREDAPGSLVGILHEFAARSINLTRLESRPTRKGLGDYCFLIDCEGHISDEVLGEALRNIHTKQGNVKFLGSYPSTYGTEEEKNTNREAVSNADGWLSGIRAQIR
ncbi:prephenate dehydratase [Acidimicrobiales bacterium]|nr:prephenate dehydratase [Acidimicrobiales bacterium]